MTATTITTITEAGTPKEYPLATAAEGRRHAEDRIAAGEDQRQGPIGAQRSEGDNERLQPAERDQRAVDEPADRAEGEPATTAITAARPPPSRRRGKDRRRARPSARPKDRCRPK